MNRALILTKKLGIFLLLSLVLPATAQTGSLLSAEQLQAITDWRSPEEQTCYYSSKSPTCVDEIRSARKIKAITLNPSGELGAVVAISPEGVRGFCAGANCPVHVLKELPVANKIKVYGAILDEVGSLGSVVMTTNVTKGFYDLVVRGGTTATPVETDYIWDGQKYVYMPHDGMAVAELAEHVDPVYAATLRPVDGSRAFVVYCGIRGNNHLPNRHCQPLKQAKTYRVTRVTETSPKTYTLSEVLGTKVLGGLMIGDPSNALGTVLIGDPSIGSKTEIAYAVAGASLAQDIFSAMETADKERKPRAAFQALGLHSGQAQAHVKLLLQQQGFKPWQCVSMGGGVTCMTTRHRGSSEEEITLLFRNVTRQDQDTGVAQVVTRLLSTVGYSPVIDGEEVKEPLTAGPAPF